MKSPEVWAKEIKACKRLMKDLDDREMGRCGPSEPQYIRVGGKKVYCHTYWKESDN